MAFCGLAAKSYCYVTDDKKFVQRSKGVTKAAAKTFTLDDYIQCAQLKRAIQEFGKRRF